MADRVRVSVDAMGGDNAPAAIVEGAMMALSERNDIEVILVGDETGIRRELEKYPGDKDRVRVVHASEVISMDEPPVAAIRSKKDSSMVVGMKLVSAGEADAFVSGGSSGALLVGAQLIVGRLKGIKRPPFATLIPTKKGVSLLLDCGANVDARSDHLVTFARIGTLYMKHIVGVSDPSTGIINIGAEEEKGNALVKETFPLLKEEPGIRFIGSVEARDIPMGGCDILVCEGFTGNVVLKMMEGTANMLLGSIREALMQSLRGKIGGALIKPSLKKLLKAFDASEYGGAPLLGLKGLVVKVHGNSKAGEVRQAIFQCADFTSMKMTDKIQEYASQL